MSCVQILNQVNFLSALDRLSFYPGILRRHFAKLSKKLSAESYGIFTNFHNGIIGSFQGSSWNNFNNPRILCMPDDLEIDARDWIQYILYCKDFYRIRPNQCLASSPVVRNLYMREARTAQGPTASAFDSFKAKLFNSHFITSTAPAPAQAGIPNRNPASGLCQFPGCSKPVFPGSDYCTRSHREYVRRLMSRELFIIYLSQQCAQASSCSKWWTVLYTHFRRHFWLYVEPQVRLTPFKIKVSK